MAGYPRSRAEIDARVGALSLQTRQLLDAWLELSETLTSIGEADLYAVYGETAESHPQVDLVRNAAGNGGVLARLASGQAWGGENGDARDLYYFWRQCWGLN